MKLNDLDFKFLSAYALLKAILDPKGKLYSVPIKCVYWTPLEQYFSKFSMHQNGVGDGKETKENTCYNADSWAPSMERRVYVGPRYLHFNK